MSERNYQEIVEDLDELAGYELVIQTARQDDDAHLAVVTVDGITRGVISRESVTEALDEASERVVAAREEAEREDEYDDEDDVDEDEESAFDRVVEALESAATLLRRLRR